MRRKWRRCKWHASLTWVTVASIIRGNQTDKRDSALSRVLPCGRRTGTSCALLLGRKRTDGGQIGASSVTVTKAAAAATVRCGCRPGKRSAWKRRVIARYQDNVGIRKSVAWQKKRENGQLNARMHATVSHTRLDSAFRWLKFSLVLLSPTSALYGISS